MAWTRQSTELGPNLGLTPAIGHQGTPGCDRGGCYIHARWRRTGRSPPIWGVKSHQLVTWLASALMILPHD
jgi:hypothetical protein